MKTKTTLERVLDVIDSAIAPKPAPPAEPPHVSASKAILQLHPLEVSKGELAHMTGCKLAYAEGARTIASHNYLTGKQRWLEHQAALVRQVQAGKADAASGYSIEEFQAEEENIMTAAKTACREASAAAIPVARIVAKRFSDIATKFAAEQETAERASYSRFGLSYPGQSPLIKTLAEVSDWALAKVPQSVAAAGCGTAPDLMLPYVQL